jgi:hypothetical protein
VREVKGKSEMVWEWKQSDLPSGVVQQNTHASERLASGKTVIFASRSKTAAHPNVQAIEVTPDKKVVWILQDGKNLGPRRHRPVPGSDRHPREPRRAAALTSPIGARFAKFF